MKAILNLCLFFVLFTSFLGALDKTELQNFVKEYSVYKSPNKNSSSRWTFTFFTGETAPLESCIKSNSVPLFSKRIFSN